MKISIIYAEKQAYELTQQCDFILVHLKMAWVRWLACCRFCNLHLCLMNIANVSQLWPKCVASVSQLYPESVAIVHRKWLKIVSKATFCFHLLLLVIFIRFQLFNFLFQPITGTDLPTHDTENLVQKTLQLLANHKKEQEKEKKKKAKKVSYLYILIFSSF